MSGLPAHQFVRAAREVRVTARLPRSGSRPLPDFLIIGGQRCGTTSLYNYLADHPSIRKALGKELHFFSTRWDRGPRWYQAHFPRRGTGAPTLCFEATPYYLVHPWAPARAAEVVPDAKLIALLRDPVERAYSHYLHSVRLGSERLSFAEAIRREPERLEGEVERMLADPSYESRSLQDHSYATRGRYAEQLERWRASFAIQQMHVVIAEDLYTRPGPTFRALLDFLELDAWEPEEFGVFTKRPAGQHAGLTPELRTHLADEFESCNSDLAQMLDRELPW